MLESLDRSRKGSRPSSVSPAARCLRDLMPIAWQRRERLKLLIKRQVRLACLAAYHQRRCGEIPGRPGGATRTLACHACQRTAKGLLPALQAQGWSRYGAGQGRWRCPTCPSTRGNAPRALACLDCGTTIHATQIEAEKAGWRRNWRRTGWRCPKCREKLIVR